MSKLRSELKLTRSRVEAQARAVADTRESLAAISVEKFPRAHAAVKARLERQEASLEESKAVLAELELAGGDPAQMDLVAATAPQKAPSNGRRA